mgnify:CR=1 FL=1
MSKEQFNDEWGMWQIEGNGVRTLIEPSQKWLDEHPPVEPQPKPESTVLKLKKKVTALEDELAAAKILLGVE